MRQWSGCFDQAAARIGRHARNAGRVAEQFSTGDAKVKAPA